MCICSMTMSHWAAYMPRYDAGQQSAAAARVLGLFSAIDAFTCSALAQGCALSMRCQPDMLCGDSTGCSMALLQEAPEIISRTATIMVLQLNLLRGVLAMNTQLRGVLALA